jgi:hypothetical protein
MPSGTTSLTQEEVDYLANSVLSKRIAMRGDVNALDRINRPEIDYIFSKAKSLGNPTSDGYKFMVKGRRGQTIQWWDGADILTFQNRHTLTDMQFDVGRAHMGFELLYQFIELHGIRIDYAKGIRKGGAAPGAVLERVVNIIEDHLDSVMDDWKRDLAHRFWRANGDQPKCFIGFDGLFPATANNVGTVGGRPRTNPMFRHQLFAGAAIGTLQPIIYQARRAANRRASKGKIEYWAAGDAVYDMLVSLFLGTNAAAGKVDFRMAQDRALKMGEKYNVTLPSDCFAIDDQLIVNTGTFEELDEIEPAAAVPWRNRLVGMNCNHMGIVPVMDEKHVAHGMPYNQRLERTSIHGEYVVWTNQPGAQVLITLA